MFQEPGNVTNWMANGKSQLLPTYSVTNANSTLLTCLTCNVFSRWVGDHLLVVLVVQEYSLMMMLGTPGKALRVLDWPGFTSGPLSCRGFFYFHVSKNFFFFASFVAMYGDDDLVK